MKRKRQKVLLIVALMPLFAQAFIVKGIQYQGLVRVPMARVQANNPVTPGGDLTPALSNVALNDLFKTGYFQNIQFYNQNGILVIEVEELPTIAAINIKGNQLIKTDQLKTVLNNVGLQVGNVFNQTLINQIKQSLVSEYNTQGKYAVQVSVDPAPISANRVSIDINISEGLNAKIKDINITGNQVFSSKQLIKQLPVSTSGWFTFFSSKDVYTSDKMQQTIQALTDFYLNHGYLDVTVNSSEASLDSTHTKAYLTFNISEGKQYTFSGFNFKGNLILPEAQLMKLVSIKSGAIYSKAIVQQAQQSMVYAIGDKGYAFVNINPVMTVDKAKRTVFITFYVTPGQKVYIQQVEFSGNTVVNDATLRERMKFVEGSTYSKTKIDQSTIALQQLPYLPGVQQSIEPVTGSNNQVDVNYKLSEAAANTVNAAIGYGGFYGLLFQAGFNLNDLFGTGNTFGVNAQISRPYQSVNINLIQPYFTLSGVSQSEGLYFSRTDAGAEGLTNFSTNSFGATLSYGIPISTWNTLNVGGQVDHTVLQEPGDSTSATVSQFINQYGSKYNTYSLNFGISRNSTNNPFFPTSGTKGNIGANVAMPGSQLTYYQMNANGGWYHAFNPYVTVLTSLGGAYGNGYGNTAHLPFFHNYYAGGWGDISSGLATVRGYEDGEMGPQDTIICTDPALCTVGTTSQGQALGGNLLVNANLEFYFPVPFTSSPNMKIISFVDAGNVYQTYYSPGTWNASSNSSRPTFKNIGFTAGIGFESYIPLLGGMLGFDIAKPLNNTPNSTQFFDFTLGTAF